ncbi:hypothetical protein ACFE04_021649 [Oxalis oulophora]
MSLYLSDNEEDEEERENSGKKEGVESIDFFRSSSTQEFLFQDGGSKNFIMAPQCFGSIPNGVEVDIPTSSITNSKDIGSSLVSNKTLSKFFEISDEKDGKKVVAQEVGKVHARATELEKQITYGSVIELMHKKTKYRLHSHNVPYGSGS